MYIISFDAEILAYGHIYISVLCSVRNGAWEQVSDVTWWGSIYLIYYSSEKESYLHEHEVCGWVEVGEADEGEVVVQAVQAGRHQVEAQHPPVGRDALQ